MNNNAYDIKLMGNRSHYLVQFLDLEIFKKDNKPATRNYFKNINNKGYISTPGLPSRMSRLIC